MLGRYGGKGLTAGGVARGLNLDGIPTPRGGVWSTAQVLRMVPLAEHATPPPAAAQARPKTKAKPQEYTIRNDAAQITLEDVLARKEDSR